MRRILGVTALLFAFPAHAVVTIEWVTVGDAGNAGDPDTSSLYGAVSYEYRIGKYQVSNAEYTEFLNAVAYTDTNTLYNTGMDSVGGPSFLGGITRSGNSGSYSYSAIPGRENMPVNYVSWYDTLRFANWLRNLQPTGAQDSTTTEDGAYDMSLGSGVVRKAGATVALTSEDEWYKAAYYDTNSMSYFDYPASSGKLRQRDRVHHAGFQREYGELQESRWRRDRGGELHGFSQSQWHLRSGGEPVGVE